LKKCRLWPFFVFSGSLESAEKIFLEIFAQKNFFFDFFDLIFLIFFMKKIQ